MVDIIGKFKDISFKDLDSSGGNALQDINGSIRASALYFATGRELTGSYTRNYWDNLTYHYPDSAVYLRAGVPLPTIKPYRHDTNYLREAHYRATPLGADGFDTEIENYFNSVAPDGYKYGDLNRDSIFGPEFATILSAPDTNLMARIAGYNQADRGFTNNFGGSPITFIDSNVQATFNNWVGKNGATPIPGFEDIRMSMFRGVGRHYGSIVTQFSQPFNASGDGGVLGIASPPDASGFGWRVKLVFPEDQTGNFFTTGTYLLVSNPFHDNNRGCVQLFRIAATDDRIYQVGTVFGENEGDYFGYSLDADQRHFVVGAPFYNTNDGRAYVFRIVFESGYPYNNLVNSGTAGLSRTLTAPSSGKYFGSAVAINSKIDRVAVGDQTIQYANDATYGYQIGKVQLSTFLNSYTTISYFDNPNPQAFSFSTSENHVINFGIGGAFNSTTAAYDDGTINYTEGNFLPNSLANIPFKTLAFAFNNELIVSGFGGYSLSGGKSRVYAFDATDGTYLYSNGAGSTTYTDTYGRFIDGDSDNLLLSAPEERGNGGGTVRLMFRGGATMGERDKLDYFDQNSLLDWGLPSTAKFGRVAAIGPKHVAVLGLDASNVPVGTEDVITIFLRDGSNTFNSVYKSITLTGIQAAADSDYISESSPYIRAINDISIETNDSSGRSYIAISSSNTFASSTARGDALIPLPGRYYSRFLDNPPEKDHIYRGIVAIYSLDDIDEITILGEEPV